MGEQTAVLVIDDDKTLADDVADLVCSLDLEPRLITSGFSDIDSLLSHVDSDVLAVLCDHKLSYGAHASFFGAEFVAKLYRVKPAVLLTAYVNAEEIALEIRAHRRKIPVVLRRSEVDDPAQIEAAIVKARDEVNGVLAPDRTLTRSLVRIDGVDDRREVATVFVVNWMEEAFEIPMEILPPSQVSEILRSGYFVANVNIGAQSTADVFVEFLAAAPDPVDL